jgi:hypothetical protein
MSVPVNKLSNFTLAISGSALVAGLIAGAVSYLNRSSTVEAVTPGTNAIPVHIVIIIVTIILIVLVVRQHARRPKNTLILLAPFSKIAHARFKRTLFVKDGVSLGKILRALLCIPLGLFFLLFFWRAGLQVIGGLDPNFVNNAWGGPTYIGASLIHWLDGILLFYVGAGLLNLVMLKKH